MGSIFISGVDLNFLSFIILAKKVKIVDIIFSESFTKILMCFHAYRCKLAPKSCIGIIVVMEIVSGAMSEHANNLFKFTLSEREQQQQDRQ